MYCLENIFTFCFTEYISILNYLISANLLIFMELPDYFYQHGLQLWQAREMQSVVSTSTTFTLRALTYII